jgi:hypothetical protein
VLQSANSVTDQRVDAFICVSTVRCLLLAIAFFDERIDPSLWRTCVWSKMGLGNITVLRHGCVAGTCRVRGGYVAGTWRVRAAGAYVWYVFGKCISFLGLRALVD